jgi:L-lactate dehydrogenase complex protein LldG
VEREPFLDSIRRSLTSARFPRIEDSDPGLLVPDLGDADLTDHFAAALERADGTLHTADPVDVITRIARRLDTDRFMSWDADQLPVPDLIETLAGAGLARIEHDHGHADDGRRRRMTDYRSLMLGITGAEAGFAESGSIVVRSGPGRPRMASLIPAVHVALLSRAAIHRSLAHWAATMAPEMATATNVVFISGPSRTGDIEMRLNKGVHGPGEVHVVLV